MAKTAPSVTLKPGREKPVLGRHPWIFSGALDRFDPVEPGGIVDVRDAKGRFLGRGYANAQSKLVVRVLTWDEGEAIDQAFWQRRIAAAVARRAPLLASAD